MQDSIKQQNTFTTIAAANVEVIACYIATVGVMNGSTYIASKLTEGYSYSVQSLR